MKNLWYLSIIVLFIACEKTSPSPENDSVGVTPKSWNVEYQIVCDTIARLDLSYIDENGEKIRAISLNENGQAPEAPWSYSMQVHRDVLKEKIHLRLSLIRAFPGYRDALYTLRIKVDGITVEEKTGITLFPQITLVIEHYLI